jgi:hypothetical protein
MYVNGNGFRAIERQTGVNHNTVIQWVKQAADSLPDVPQNLEIPEVTQVDELETFVGKKTKCGFGQQSIKAILWILAWVLGDRSTKSFEKLWR